MDDDSADPKSGRPRPIWLAVFFGVALATQLVYMHWVSGVFPEDLTAGTFGDMFGGVNAAFTGLALAALIFTIWQQHSSLRMQQRDLQATLDEIKDSVAVQKEMAQIQRMQYLLDKSKTAVEFRLLCDEYSATQESLAADDAVEVYEVKLVNLGGRITSIQAELAQRDDSRQTAATPRLVDIIQKPGDVAIEGDVATVRCNLLTTEEQQEVKLEYRDYERKSWTVRLSIKRTAPRRVTVKSDEPIQGTFV